MTIQSWIVVSIAFVLSLLVPFALRPILRSQNVIDIPNARSSHSNEVLRGGGVAQLLGVSAGLSVEALLVAQSPPSYGLFRIFIILAVMVGIGILGLIEDTRGVPVFVRAVSQLLVGMVGASVLVLSSGISPWWIAVGALFFVAYTNAANFMDGIDTVSALHGLTVGGLFAIIGVLSSSPWLVTSGLVLAVSFVSFLPWNIGPRRIFLGDVGSYLLGGGIAIVSIAAATAGVPVIALVGPLAIYLADTGTTLFMRVVRGERWQDAHRLHVYQRLVDAGLSHIRVSLIVTVSTIVSGAFGLLALVGSPAETLFAVVGVALTVGLYLALPQLSLRAVRQRMRIADGGEN